MIDQRSDCLLCRPQIGQLQLFEDWDEQFEDDTGYQLLKGVKTENVDKVIEKLKSATPADIGFRVSSIYFAYKTPEVLQIGTTPLIEASRIDNIEIVKLLLNLDSELDVLEYDSTGASAYSVAARLEHRTIASLL